MKLKDWLAEATKQLDSSHISTARLDCLVLLEDLLDKDRAQILAHDKLELTAEQISKLNKQIEQRAQHIPLAYIRGKTEFYGREFLVSPDTLEPRPETETMIDLVKALKLPKPARIADVGAGSGAIGITLAFELPNVTIDMYEISAPAIKIATQNIRQLSAPDCNIYKNDLLSSVKTKYDVIVANLPYVPDSHTINQAALQEPPLAIFGGPDGLDVYRLFFLQIAGPSPKFVLTESLPFQHEELSKIAKRSGFSLLKTDDFIQLFEQSAKSNKQ